MSPENQADYYRPIAAIERAFKEKARIVKSYPQVIGIDGLSAVGKGTLAGKLADLLHVHYFNTGLVYRAITVASQMENIPVQQLTDAELTKALQDITVFYPSEAGPTQIDIITAHSPKQAITHLTQTKEVELITSRIVAPRIPTRTKVLALQQQFLRDNPACVMEGRNMREVLKDIPAENKFLMYLFASPDELARRLQNRRPEEPLEVAEGSVLNRIRSDYNREHGRVYPPYEATKSNEYNLIIDSTHMVQPEVLLTTLSGLLNKVQPPEKMPLPIQQMAIPVR